MRLACLAGALVAVAGCDGHHCCNDCFCATLDAAVDASAVDALLPMAVLGASPTSITEPATMIGAPAVMTTVTITNTVAGQASGQILAMVSGATDFAIVANGCTLLTSHSTCTIVLAFTPTRTGPIAADLVVSASPGGAVTVHATGTGL